MKKKIFKITILVLILILCGCGCSKPAQKAEPKHLQVYSVATYLKTATNSFGAITSQKIVYTFTYITSSGEVEIFETYDPDHYNHSIQVGDTDELVVYSSDLLNGSSILYLTEETISNLNTGAL